MDLSTWTKKKMTEKCQEILRRGYVQDDEQDFLHEIIKNHTEYEQKKGIGIKRFFIQKNKYHVNGFYLERLDGSVTDFSYKHSISPRSDNLKISMACRSAIRCDVLDVKNGEMNTHVHHDTIPFADIVRQWREQNPEIDLTLNATVDNNEFTYFVNKLTEESFRQFHRKMATMKVMTAQGHMRHHGLRKENEY